MILVFSSDFPSFVGFQVGFFFFFFLRIFMLLSVGSLCDYLMCTTSYNI